MSGFRFYDAQEVRDAARDRWPSLLGALGVDARLLSGTHGPCPGCGGRDRFRFDDKSGAGTFICSRGGGEPVAGDGVALLMHVRDIEWKEAVNLLGDALGLAPREGERRAPVNPGVAAAPRAPKVESRPEVDREYVAFLIRSTPEVDEEWLRRRSPVDPRGVTAGDFLNALYEPGERVLVFENQRSQGDFLWVAGNPALPDAANVSLRGGWRLAQQRGVAAVKSELPQKSKDGVWYLVQPVSGQWEIKPDVTFTADAEGKTRREVDAHYTRRSAVNVRQWRYFVLESDELPMEEWLRVVVTLPVPIAALYTSGGRSVHALVRMPCGSKAMWDAVRDNLRPIVCPLGADPAALSAVRLSRLPGCFRGEREQRLLYLAPNPEPREMRMMKEVRA